MSEAARQKTVTEAGPAEIARTFTPRAYAAAWSGCLLRTTRTCGEWLRLLWKWRDANSFPQRFTVGEGTTPGDWWATHRVTRGGCSGAT